MSWTDLASSFIADPCYYLISWEAEIVKTLANKVFHNPERNGAVHLLFAKEEVLCLCPPPQSGNSQGPSFYLGKVSRIVSGNFRSL